MMSAPYIEKAWVPFEQVEAARLAERARIRAIVIEETMGPERFWLGELILDRIDGSHDGKGSDAKRSAT